MRGPKALRELLRRPGLITAPGAYDCITARLVERAGFPAVYITGGGSSVARTGHPDLGLMTQTEMSEQLTRIASLVSIPVIADADTGFGNALNVIRAVRDFERAGAAALHIEDQVFPKRCGHLPNKEVIDSAEFEMKIRAACDARQDEDFVIIARTDARAPHGLQAAIERANRYAAAGADVVFVEAPESLDEVAQIAREVDAPLLIDVLAKSRTPDISTSELERLGYKIAVYPTINLSAAISAMTAALERLQATGLVDLERDTPATVTLRNVSPEEIFALADFDQWTEALERYDATPARSSV